MPTAFHEILKDAAQPIWEAILAHPYLKELGAGTLPHDRFLYFIRQDYLYLFEFARVLCAGGSRAEDLDTLEMFAKHAANTVAVERVMHTGFIQRLGLQADHLLDSERTPPPRPIRDTSWQLPGRGPSARSSQRCCHATGSTWRSGATSPPRSPAIRFYRDWIKAYGFATFTALVQQQLNLWIAWERAPLPIRAERMTEHFHPEQPL